MTHLETELRARLRAVENQRNRALADQAIAEGTLAVMQMQVEALMVQNKELTERLEMSKEDA